MVLDTDGDAPSRTETEPDRSHEQDQPTAERGLLRRMVTDPLSAAGLAIVTLFVLAAILAPLLSPHDPNAINATQRLMGPSGEHWLGTDELGRDTFSRLVYGARWSLGTAAVASFVVMVIGVTVGALAGYYGGWLDAVSMRVVDVLFAFPSLILILAIVGTLGPGLRNLMIALIATSWVTYARVVRGLVLSLRERGFVRASLALGARDRRLVFRHILPNVVPPVVVLASLQIGGLILALAALGFFGLGVQPPTPEWGSMINQSRLYLQVSPILMIWPGLAISLTVIGFNLLGDGLRDVLDPRLTRSGGGRG